MGRGAQTQTRNLTDQQLANTNSLNQQLTGQQQQIGNTLVPQFQNIVNNPGLSPADQASVTGQSQGAAGELLRFAATSGSKSAGAHTELCGIRRAHRRTGAPEGNCASWASANQLNFSNTAFQPTDVRAARTVWFVWRGFKFIGAHAGNSRGAIERPIQCVEKRERIFLYAGLWAGFDPGRLARCVVLNFKL